MKLNHLMLGVFALVVAAATAALAAPVTSVFVYQGFLRDGAGPANGLYEIHFRLYDAGTNGTLLPPEIVEPSLAVSNGAFVASLDFGSGAFTSDARWLELAVGRPGDTNGPTVLQPRQPITATPYASYALAAPVALGSVAAAQLATGAVQTVNLGAAVVTGDKIASQQVVRSLNGLTDQVTLDVGAGLALNTEGGNTLRITSTMPNNPLDAYVTNYVTAVAGSTSTTNTGTWSDIVDSRNWGGWGSALGTIPRIDSLTFWIKPFTNGTVSLVDVQLRFNSSTGQVVAHSQLPVTATNATPVYVNWTLPAPILNTDSNVIFFQYIANDRVTVMQANSPSYLYPTNQTPGAYWFGSVSNQISALAVNPDAAQSPYKQLWVGTPTNNQIIFATWSTNTGAFTVSQLSLTNIVAGVVSNSLLSLSTLLENVSNSLTNYATTAFATNSAWQAATQLESTLPPTLFASTASANNSYSLMSVPTHFPVLYATAGHNLSLYNLGFLWPGGLAPAYAQWNTLLGTNYSRCWLNTFGNTNAATNSLSWVVASGDITLLTLPLSLVVSSNTAGAGVTRKVLIVGDSTTADGQPTRDLLNLFKNDTMAITLLGTVNSGGGTNRHEGHPGWAYSTFDRSTNSPFVFSGAFDFRTYLGTNGWTLATNDWVIFNLGINDIYTCASDASAGASSATAFGDASNMIANIESVVPGIRVGVCLTIPPSADADSFAQRIALYGVGRDRYVRNRAIFNSYLLANYKSWGTNVFVIPLSAALDDIYDFTTALQPESLDITNLVLRGTDGIHPNAIGYQQVANMYFHFLKGNEK